MSRVEKETQLKEEQVIAVGGIELRRKDPRRQALEKSFYDHLGFSKTEAHASASDFARFLDGYDWIVREGQYPNDSPLVVDICQPDSLLSIYFPGFIVCATIIESGVVDGCITREIARIRLGDVSDLYRKGRKAKKDLLKGDYLFFEDKKGNSNLNLRKKDGKIVAEILAEIPT